MVAIEFGMWRSGRIGGTSGSVTVGNGRTESGAAKPGPEVRWHPFGDQEAVSGDAECGVMVEAAPPRPS